VCAGFALSAVCAVLAPLLFWVPLALLAIAAATVLVFRHLAACCVIWLLIAGATLEMTLGDLLGPGGFQAALAAVKFAELLLALLCVLRYGPALDLCNPALVFLAIFITGL